VFPSALEGICSELGRDERGVGCADLGVFEPERKGLKRDSLIGEGSGTDTKPEPEPEPDAEPEPRSEVDLERAWAELRPVDSCKEPDELREREVNETEWCSPGRAGVGPSGAGEATREDGRDEGRE
jgi:hypothetical protein